MPREGKKVLSIILIFSIAVVVLIGLSVSSSKGKSPVKITVLPEYATVSINGKKTSGGTQKLKPGKYTFQATQAGFESAEEVLVIEKKSQPKTVRLLLTPVSSAALTWASNNQDAYQQIESQSGLEAANDGENFIKTHPIASSLPYKNLIFNIDYAASNSIDGFKLIITASSATDRQYALNQIKDWGYNPSDYEIEFTGFNNPLLGVN